MSEAYPYAEVFATILRNLQSIPLPVLTQDPDPRLQNRLVSFSERRALPDYLIQASFKPQKQTHSCSDTLIAPIRALPEPRLSQRPLFRTKTRFIHDW